MNKNIVVLGGGLVGGPIALDLSRDKELSVTVIDKDINALDKIRRFPDIQTQQIKLSESKIVKDVVQEYDLVVSAVPGFLGFQTLKAVIEAGKDVVDIAFFPEDMFLLDPLAKDKDITVICDMGVAPGMSHLLASNAFHQLESTELIKIFAGGLPKKRIPPYEYKAVFSPLDVIEEYTRPARLVTGGKEVTKPALSDLEQLEFHNVGVLEAFNSDGLRSLISTLKAPEMIEKTLRYPGHVEKIKLLRDTGYFNKEKIDLGYIMISPMDMTRKLLFRLWKLEEKEADITVMKVIVEGKKEGRSVRYTYDLYDEYDHKTGIHSMARTTGYAATMAVRMILEGLYKNKGINPPEFIGRHPECVKYMLEGLKAKGVVYKEIIERIP
ncbi:MAG: saccharopine dehydrogenase NADP-binding domain-containing protein, partial [Bacteroidetes bacterium]|nr:saccharopine dehydrogenase NADP-binding domain-containing protein [Bacteroidota bacterium]